ncbi:hypothetical protein [Streptomyces kaempferi]|uniref:Uncharacterized protein n=1 Tax=Streptomyces kaempferi TaxID=333725 RepID=A0ABW3XLL2_9ACTN
MPDASPSYVTGLAAELRTRRPDLLDAAENELKELRIRLATIARFINTPTTPLDIRQGLARDLHLPEPIR